MKKKAEAAQLLAQEEGRDFNRAEFMESLEQPTVEKLTLPTLFPKKFKRRYFKKLRRCFRGFQRTLKRYYKFLYYAYLVFGARFFHYINHKNHQVIKFQSIFKAKKQLRKSSRVKDEIFYQTKWFSVMGLFFRNIRRFKVNTRLSIKESVAYILKPQIKAEGLPRKLPELVSKTLNIN